MSKPKAELCWMCGAPCNGEKTNDQVVLDERGRCMDRKACATRAERANTLAMIYGR